MVKEKGVHRAAYEKIVLAKIQEKAQDRIEASYAKLPLNLRQAVAKVAKVDKTTLTNTSKAERAALLKAANDLIQGLGAVRAALLEYHVFGG